MRWLISCLFLIVLCKSANSYFIIVDAHSEECFFDRVEQGTKMGLTFEIAEGGFLDIDVKIMGPGGNVIYQGDQESSGKYTFAADVTGDYTYCFSNLKGSMTPKVIMFNMDIGDTPTPVQETSNGQKDANHGKLDDMIKELTTSLWGVKNEQEYMQVRDRKHREINESTNSRVVIWSFLEAMVLICMTLAQILYMKRFFEVRRVI